MRESVFGRTALVAISLFAAPGGAAVASIGTAFTYQGRLDSGGSPVSGSYDMQFTLRREAVGGSIVAGPVCIDNVSVQGGLFTTLVDFGPDVFNGEARWLEIGVRPDGTLGNCAGGTFSVLAPLQELTAAPNALFATMATDAAQLNGQAAAFYQDASNINSGTLADTYLSSNVARLNQEQMFTDFQHFGTQVYFYNAPSPFEVDSTGLVTNLNADLLDGLNSSAFLQSVPMPLTLTGSSGTHVIRGENTSASTNVSGVRGEATSPIAPGSYGVYGLSAGPGGTGVYGTSTYTAGAASYGVQGHVSSTTGSGVYGNATAATGTASGVWGQSASTSGRGVYGLASAASGVTNGGYFQSTSPDGWGVFGYTNAAGGSSFGVVGRSDSTSGRGVYGLANALTGTTYGVYGQNSSTSGNGVFGQATTTTGTNYGGRFESYSTSGRGVYGEATAATGTTYGGLFKSESTSGHGVYGWASASTGTGRAVRGECNSPDGFAGYFNGGKNYFSGNVGIGTSSPSSALDVVGRIRLRQDVPASSGNSAGIDLYQQNPADDRAFIGMRDDNQVGLYGRGGSGWSFVMDVNNGNIGIGTTSPAAKLHVNGTARCDVLEIMGADLAEKFPVSEAAKPGLVMEIDPQNPGKLRVARGEYNRRVAGVVSGANGLSAGTIMGHLPGSESEPPIALSGRVWVSCDASREAVEVGDLLTTSSAPGHAMKVVDYPRAQGAAIGKAMTGLPRGEVGFVLVLVNLQ